MIYLKGAEMPCDYGSRHPKAIDHLTLEEQKDLGFDHGQDVYVRRMINISKSPAALKSEDIRLVAEIQSV